MLTESSTLLPISELQTQAACALAANLLIHRQWMLTTAESCTGGLIAASCTDLAGSSAWFERGFVTYSDASKTELLGVDATLIEHHGAVSQAVASAMATGALSHSRAQVAVAVTGIAGPTGGSANKPVGTVWFAWGLPSLITTQVCHFEGDRAQVRLATVNHALTKLVALISGSGIPPLEF